MGCLLNLLNKPGRVLDEYVEAPAMRSRRRPKQTVHPASKRRMKATNVIQNPGAVLVCRVTLVSLSTWCLRYTNNAISMAKATMVRRAARNDIKDDKSVTVTWVEHDSKNAMKVTAAATG